VNETESGLPPVVEQLWGLQGPSRRGGPKPALSLQRIVAAAVELADAGGGLAALSMSRLAEKLGFTTMSLYRYVASKDDLLVLVLDAALELPPEAPDGDWREQCAVWARALRDGYRAHPWALELPISGLPAGPNQLVWFDRGLGALAGLRLAAGEKASAILLLSTYVRGQTQLVLDLTRSATAATATPSADWATVVTRLADPARYPEVAKVVEAGVFEDGEDDFGEEEFDFGLQRVLDGIEVLHRSRVSP
jgi:AcrR family transcriptional regulator